MTRADILLEVVDAFDSHVAEHRATVQQVLGELDAGEKPRLVVYNKADLLESGAREETNPAPMIGDAVLISALTGYGIDTLRTRLSAQLADLWEDVDAVVPYTLGELIARIRERGTVDVEYRATDVRVRGRVAPQLAGELRAAAGAIAAQRD